MGLFSDIFGGADKEQKDLAANQAAFAKDLQSNTATAFQGSQQLINQLQKEWAPITSAGINQYGFSTAEDAQIQNNIINAGATQTANTVAAEQLRQQQVAGGADVLPSGAKAALDEQARIAGTQQTATALGQEKLAGYETGRQNFLAGTSAEEKLAGTQAGLAGTMGSTAVAGEKQASASQQTVTDANKNSLLAKVLGGAINVGTSFATGGLSNILGGGSFMSPASAPASAAAVAKPGDFPPSPQ